MTELEASRYWGIRPEQTRRILDNNLLPINGNEIPDCYKRLVTIDKRFNKLNNLSRKHVIILLLTFIKYGYYFNARLLQIDDDRYESILEEMIEEELIIKEDEYFFLTDKGNSEFNEFKKNNNFLLRSLVSSIKLIGKVRKEILEQIEA